MGARRAAGAGAKRRLAYPHRSRKTAPPPAHHRTRPGEQHLPASRVIGYAWVVVDHLVGISEIAQMLGVSRQRAVQLVGGYDDFPAPNATLAAGRIWERNQVEAWMAKHPERKPGRPTRKSRTGDGTTGE